MTEDNPINELRPNREVIDEHPDPTTVEDMEDPTPDYVPDTAKVSPVEPIREEPKKKKFSFDLFARKKKGSENGSVKKPKKKSIYQKMVEWLHGTPEHPVPPFSWKGKLHRWYMQQYKGYVIYITTHYDRQLDEYVYVKELVPRSSVPREAVHVTNQKNTYHLDIDLPRRGFNTAKDNGFTAVDAYLWMKCSKIDEAMAIKLDSPLNIDIKKYIPLIAVAFGLFCGVYYYIVMM